MKRVDGYVVGLALLLTSGCLDKPAPWTPGAVDAEVTAGDLQSADGKGEIGVNPLDGKGEVPAEVGVVDAAGDGVVPLDVHDVAELATPDAVDAPDLPDLPDLSDAPETEALSDLDGETQVDVGADAELVVDADLPCIPDCKDKVCGDSDGCGGMCTACPGEQELCVLGKCECIPACEGKDCGPDGCDGSCGDCGANEQCSDEGLCECLAEVVECGDVCCAPGEVCHADQCCLPDCEGKECGSDGCGGNCGECDDENPCTDDYCLEGGTCQFSKKQDGTECELQDGCVGTCLNGECVTVEVCDGQDNDCDDQVDEGFPNYDEDEQADCVDPDDDNDGHLDDVDCEPQNEAVPSCDGKECGDDGCGGSCGECDDDNPCTEDVCPAEGTCDHPKKQDETECSGEGICAGQCVDGVCTETAVEVCDGEDNDCDEDVDEELGSLTCGKGECLHTVPACFEGQPQECNPMEGAQDEMCDGLDNDCDGEADEELGTLSCGKGPCFHTIAACVDGNPQQCDPLEGAEEETCDGIDNDCDGDMDEAGADGCTTYYYDGDTDSWGVQGNTKCLCSPVAPYVATKAGDCDDGNAAAHPGGEEVCDGADNDCDNSIDPEDTAGCKPYFKDVDSDDWGTDDVKCLCEPKGLHKALQAGDCEPLNPDVSPGQDEVCNGIDDNCDSKTDPEDSGDCQVFYLDEDVDTWGTNDTKCLCVAGDFYTATQAGDCNDGDPDVHPGGQKCGVDGDCDGELVEGDEECDDGNDDGCDGCRECTIAETIFPPPGQCGADYQNWMFYAMSTAFAAGPLGKVAIIRDCSPGNDQQNWLQILAQDGLELGAHRLDGEQPNIHPQGVNRPALAWFPDGQVAVAALAQFGSGLELYFQIFSATAEELTDRIKPEAKMSPLELDVLPLGNDLLLVAWREKVSQNGTSDLKTQLFDQEGELQGSAALLDDMLNDTKELLSSSRLGDSGEGVLVWIGRSPDNTFQIQGRLFSQSGQPTGQQFQMNAGSSGGRDRPFVAGLPSGDFVVLWWNGYWGTGPGKLMTRKFDSNGAPLTGDIVVEELAGEVWYVAVPVDNNGLAVAWLKNGQPIEMEFYASNLQTTGVHVSVSSYHGNDVYAPYGGVIAAVAQPAGEVNVVWGAGADGGCPAGYFVQQVDENGVKKYH